MALIIDEILGEMVSAGLEDALGRPGADADDPTRGGVFASAELSRRMSAAAKDLDELHAAGELTEDAAREVALKHLLPTEGTRHLVNIARETNLREASGGPKLPTEIVMDMEGVPSAEEASKLKAAEAVTDEVVDANKAAMETDVPTLTKEQRAARMAQNEGPKSIEELKKIIADQGFDDAITGTEATAMQRAKMRGEQRLAKAGKVKDAVVDTAKEVASTKPSDMAKAVAGASLPSWKTALKAGGLAGGAALLYLAGNSLFNTKVKKKDGDSTYTPPQDLNSIVEKIETAKPKQQRKIFKQLEESQKRLDKLMMEID